MISEGSCAYQQKYRDLGQITCEASILIICLMQHYSDTLTEVELYTIAIDPKITSPITLSADSSCNNIGCYHNFDLNQLNHTESNISVTITATNAVGQSSPTVCNHHLIGKMYIRVASILFTVKVSLSPSCDCLYSLGTIRLFLSS